ncbi:MAG: hypothetical protein A3J76_01600 [Candidatus Moranbacteria bacterium RBG_13_45_13]|nr:MAG: hypothetical protein A3J76_01600 [Candidatus Moranbacteria bacterium RBG_13_45_13]
MSLKQKTKNLALILIYLIKHPRKFYNALSQRGKKWALRGLIFLLVILIAVPASFWYQAKHAKAAWWNDSWAYRQKIQITNSTGADLTDFQVSTIVDTSTLITAGKMTATTCADMRFTDSRGQILDYWIEENNPGCNNASTKVWIKAPKVYSGTNATSIYMYYGNPSAIAVQDGNKVFAFFDDFNSGTLNSRKWTATGSATVAGGALTTSTGAVYTNNTVTSGAQNYVYEHRSKWSSTLATYAGISIANTQQTYSSNDPARKLAYFMSGNVASYVGAYAADGTVTGYNIANVASLYTPTADTYYVNGMAIDSGNVRYYNSRSQLDSYVGTWSDAPYLWLGYFMGSGSGTTDATDVTTDWVLVRKYASADPTTSASAEERGPGPVAYWRFDEGQGSTAQDSTVNNNDGTITGATWKQESDCVSGKCLDYDGTDDVTTVTQNSSINLTGKSGYTISTWIKADGAGENNTGEIIDKGANTYLRVDNPSGSNLDVEGQIDLASSPANLNISAGVEKNKWYHIVMVYEDDGDDEISIYINGILKGTSINGVGSLPTETNNLLIGGDSSNNFNGSIDEVKIYPYARTADQIKQDYNAGLAGSSTSSGSLASIGESPKWMTDGLVGHWKMDETSGTSVADASGNGNTGTLTNAQETGTSDASGNSVTTMVDTDGSLSTTNDAYNNMILRFTAACGSITSGTERTITDYTGSPHTFTVATLAQAPDSCAYEVRHQTGGKFGNGLGFSENDDNYVNIPDPANGLYHFSTSTSFSVSGWIKKKSGTNWPFVSNKTWSQDSGLALGSYGETQYASFYVVDTNGRLERAGDTDTFLNIDQWYHLTGVCDRTSKKLILYVNGKPSALTADIAGLDAVNGSDMQLGKLYQSLTFDGIIDDIRVYNRALSPDEVRQLSEYGPGPVGWWKFDEKTGGTVNDSSGNGNNGSFGGTGTLWSDGKYGSAGNFNPSNSNYVGINDPGSSSPLYAKTVTTEAWINLSPSASGFGGIVRSLRYGMYSHGGDDNFVCYVNIDGTEVAETYYGILTPTNTWTHVACTYDGSYIRLYYNGILKQSWAHTGNGYSTSGSLILGSNSEIGSYEVFEGKLDDVRIYNYARTPKQVVEDMNAGHPAPGSPVGSPVAYYKMDEGYGGTAQDASQNNNDGTINEATWSNSGKFGRTLSFDGTNDYVSVTDSASLDNVRNEFTISAWVYDNDPDDLTDDDRTFMDKGDTGTNANNTFIFQLDNDKKLNLSLGNGSTTQQFAGSSTVSYQTWTYVAATYDGSNADVYLNGKKDRSTTAVTIGTLVDAGNLAIGRQSAADCQSPYNACWKGNIDEVKVYNSALTPEQIALDMNQGKEMQLGGQSSATGATGQAAEYCVPGDATSCAAPVGEWKFDEKTGGTANDTSGNGNVGTWYGTGTHWARGKYGSAGSFNGSDDYIQAGSASDFNFGTGSFTVEWWGKFGSKTVVMPIDKRTTPGPESGPGYGFYMNESNNFSWRVSDDATHVAEPSTNISAIKSSWNHYVGVFDSSTKTGYLYINGVYKAKSTNASIGNTDSSVALSIGKYGGALDYVFQGQLDQVRIFNYARTPAQIAWDYNRGKPVGWWKMDEGEGDKAYDSSGNANTGTLTSMDPPNDWVTGKFGKALDFDGGNDYVNIPSNSAYNSYPLSVSAWVKFGTQGSQRGVVNKYVGASYNGYQLFVSSGDICAWYYKDASNYIGSGETCPIQVSGYNDNNWHHVSFVVDSSGGKIYVDGIFKNSLGWTGSPGACTTSQNVWIGQYDALRYTGQIDDVRIFNYALTAEQIRQTMNEGSVVRFGE